MPFFEDIRDRPKHWSLETAVGVAVYKHAKVVECVQQKPWTYVRAQVWFNGVVFEGVGFARQRQYTSLLVHRVKGFPWFRAVLAKKDEWNPAIGKWVATMRACNNLCTNVLRAYKRWAKRQLELRPKEV